jgi:hypothetical protein
MDESKPERSDLMERAVIKREGGMVEVDPDRLSLRQLAAFFVVFVQTGDKEKLRIVSDRIVDRLVAKGVIEYTGEHDADGRRLYRRSALLQAEFTDEQILDALCTEVQ